VIDGELTTYGILGVGALGEAIVNGLCRDVDDAPPVVLSPRSATTADALAQAHPSVQVAGSNQEVVDASTVVVVCLRQADVPILRELEWRPSHVVVSAVAGLGGDALAAAVAPATQVARAVPMPAVARRGWATPVRPPVPAAMVLFELLGGAIPIESDEQYDAIFTGLGTVAPFFEYLGTIAEFLTDHGLPESAARRLLSSSFAGVVEPLGDPDVPGFAELLRAHATPGGGNDQLAILMREAGVPEATRRSLDEVYRRQTAGTLP
jgi:pyrroline-5-carboxylate reductase